MVIARKCLNLRIGNIVGFGRDCVEMGHGVVGWE
jgi:hypothetical protein